MKTIVLALLAVVMILMVALFGCSSKEPNLDGYWRMINGNWGLHIQGQTWEQVNWSQGNELRRIGGGGTWKIDGMMVLFLSSANTKNGITYVYNGSDTLKGENEVLKRLP